MQGTRKGVPGTRKGVPGVTHRFLILKRGMTVPPAQQGTEQGGQKRGGREAESGVRGATCNLWVIRGWDLVGGCGQKEQDLRDTERQRPQMESVVGEITGRPRMRASQRARGGEKGGTVGGWEPEGRGLVKDPRGA